MESGAQSFASLIAQGRRFEPEHAVYLTVAACQAVMRDQHVGGVAPGRILVRDTGDVVIGDLELDEDMFGYVAPEVMEQANARPRPRFRQTQVAPTRKGTGVSITTALWGPLTEAIEPQEVDFPRADVFALGCVLWELLAGRRLFKGTYAFDSLLLARDARVPPLVDVPRELEAIVRKALAKDVECRFPTPGQFAAALADYLVVQAQN